MISAATKQETSQDTTPVAIAELPRYGGVNLVNETPAEHDARMQWFRDAKFGMFESVEDIVSARGIAGVDERVVLFHYPIDQWQGRPNGGFHLHGHVHGHGVSLARRFDVGVDVKANAMRPRAFVDLIDVLRTTPPSGFVRA